MQNQTNNNTFNSSSGNLAPVMSIGDWLIMFIVFCIPIVNLIMVLVWAFSGNGNPNRSNFCKAYLIVMAITVILYIIVLAIFGSIIANSAHQF